MAITYFPFRTGPGAGVLETQWRQMARKWRTSGPLKGELNGLSVFADSSGLQAKVNTGQGWVEGSFFQSDSIVTLPISSADPTNPRIDRVVLRLSVPGGISYSYIELVVKTGTAAASPAVPSLTQTSSTYEIALAQVSVPATDTNIDAAQVTDERQFSLPDDSGGVVDKTTETQTVASSAALVDDSHLKIPIVDVSVRYAVSGLILFLGNSTGNFKAALTYTGSFDSASTWVEIGGLTTAAGVRPLTAKIYGTSDDFGATTVTRGFEVRGTLMPTTSGILKLQWAQVTPNATATLVKRGSQLRIQRMI